MIGLSMKTMGIEMRSTGCRPSVPASAVCAEHSVMRERDNEITPSHDVKCRCSRRVMRATLTDERTGEALNAHNNVFFPEEAQCPFVVARVARDIQGRFSSWRFK